ncbi:hypothetical protein HPP92_014289 [Vanilla planifolia]|nr:hypothetical protein HPP92_014289 [Vanilla planifolia]
MLNLDNLAKLGPQWWMVRVARVNRHEISDLLARAIARGFPDMEFKVYFPTILEKKKLKNGSYSEKLKPLFPGCLFLYCVLNKEVHDYIKECDGVGGFVGSKFGYKKRLINKPKPVSAEEMEKVFQRAKEQKQLHEENFISLEDSTNTNSKQDKRKSGDDPWASNVNHLAPGATIRVVSGPFSDYTGYLKDLDHTNEKATVGITLFGKESFVDLEVDQIAAETSRL